MRSAFYLLAALAVVFGLHRLWAMARAFLRFKGARVITCPETRVAAAVDVDAGSAALAAALGPPRLRLQDCSLWPERRDCAQACLAQIESAPEECLVRTIVTTWYEGKPCALCGSPIGEIRWHDHRPGLLDAGGRTLGWYEIPAERIPDALTTHRPVCWNCHVAETFRRHFPHLVVERPSSGTGEPRSAGAPAKEDAERPEPLSCHDDGF